MFEPIPPSNLLKIYKGCSNCRTQKIKCNGLEPCSRCRAFGLQCQYIVLPNQAAHRLAAASTNPSAPSATTSDFSYSATATPSDTTQPSSALPVPMPPSSTSDSFASAMFSVATQSSPPSATGLSRSQSTKKKRGPESASRKRSHRDKGPEVEPPFVNAPAIVTSLASRTFSPSTLAFAQSLSGIPNTILHSMIEATDPALYAYRGPPRPDEPHPSSETMRHLVGLYIRYMHPVHRFVDERHPNFWSRLDRPMEPEEALIVYAMCTIGALFLSKTAGAGHLDDLVYEFYRRAWAIKDQLPQSLLTIQTYLIMMPFFIVASQTEEGTKAQFLTLEIAKRINLGEQVQKLATQGRLSTSNKILRNTWRGVVWMEVLLHLTTLQTVKIDPLKDLKSPALDVRPEETPNSKTSPLDQMYYYLCTLLKILQSITRIRLPMLPRDLYMVTAILDAFVSWHKSLPKRLRCHSTSKSSSTSSSSSSSALSATSSASTLSSPSSSSTSSSSSASSTSSLTSMELFSSYASVLDLYYRLGQIFVLNTLPFSIRSSPTGLGPRRESPLRTLATSANGITATISDMIKEPDMRHYCLGLGMRCLTEAATIQLFNSMVLDPAISTPAKVNLMKTLWCIRQLNVAVSADVLDSILSPFNIGGKPPSLNPPHEQQQQYRENPQVQRQDAGYLGSSKETSILPSFTMAQISGNFQTAAPNTKTVSASTARSRREVSQVSENSSSAASTREGSHPTIFEMDETDLEQSSYSHRISTSSPRPSPALPASATQDGAAASLLALSLESPTGPAHRVALKTPYQPAYAIPTGKLILNHRDSFDMESSRSDSAAVWDFPVAPRARAASLTAAGLSRPTSPLDSRLPTTSNLHSHTLEYRGYSAGHQHYQQHHLLHHPRLYSPETTSSDSPENERLQELQSRRTTSTGSPGQRFPARFDQDDMLHSKDSEGQASSFAASIQGSSKTGPSVPPSPLSPYSPRPGRMFRSQSSSSSSPAAGTVSFGSIIGGRRSSSGTTPVWRGSPAPATSASDSTSSSPRLSLNRTPTFTTSSLLGRKRPSVSMYESSDSPESERSAPTSSRTGHVVAREEVFSPPPPLSRLAQSPLPERAHLSTQSYSALSVGSAPLHYPSHPHDSPRHQLEQVDRYQHQSQHQSQNQHPYDTAISSETHERISSRSFGHSGRREGAGVSSYFEQPQLGHISFKTTQDRMSLDLDTTSGVQPFVPPAGRRRHGSYNPDRILAEAPHSPYQMTSISAMDHSTVSSANYIRASTVAASALESMYSEITPPSLQPVVSNRSDGGGLISDDDESNRVRISNEPPNQSSSTLRQIHALFHHQQLLQLQQQQQFEAYQLILQQQLQKEEDMGMDRVTEWRQGEREAGTSPATRSIAQMTMGPPSVPPTQSGNSPQEHFRTETMSGLTTSHAEGEEEDAESMEAARALEAAKAQEISDGQLRDPIRRRYQ